MNATTTVLQTDSLLFRPTLPDDLERICTIIRQAQATLESAASIKEIARRGKDPLAGPLRHRRRGQKRPELR